MHAARRDVHDVAQAGDERRPRLFEHVLAEAELADFALAAGQDVAGERGEGGQGEFDWKRGERRMVKSVSFVTGYDASVE